MRGTVASSRRVQAGAVVVPSHPLSPGAFRFSSLGTTSDSRLPLSSILTSCTPIAMSVQCGFVSISLLCGVFGEEFVAR